MENNYNEETLIIIENFMPKIKQCLHQTSYQEREDLEQEIKLKIIEKMATKEFKDTPGFWDFFT
ncbi:MULTISPECIES: hypothetical protein [Lysinibacillus]|uniref:hypothetical protein n=1 Tax=Lysinibacillus TaxID=400634 RepID=UPI00056269D8|nr:MULTISPECIES: hypothetical protein [Lysinibacillus]MEE3808220.1 hypothetical protein [Lysinibacillus fusiformis]SCY94227.1 hypothetical protein SAMN02787078_03191 [Lysinibacillus sp. SG9]SDB44784.1 hypothetical protein SAMN02787079_03418 [Lysinibacillus sp. TC-37]SFT08623.1 hypothetical protein SAMN02787087_03484 [Lysinibacillus sp. SG55]